MLDYVLCFFAGILLGWLAVEFTDRWGCSQRYQSPLKRKVTIIFLTGFGTTGLFWWEVPQMMLISSGLPKGDLSVAADYQRYIIHLILIFFLLASVLTDFYEMIIPDAITATGTLTALAVAAFFPLAVLPATEYSNETFSSSTLAPTIVPDIVSLPAPLHAWSPLPPEECPMMIMILLWWFWCFAMLDRIWYIRLPFRKASIIFGRYLYRSPRTPFLIGIGLFVPCAFVFVGDASSATALFSALIGMAMGMILVWAVRIVARWVLGIEAMGFGDVTLMGMIGAFIGWQAVLAVFFIAPFFGLVYAVISMILGKGKVVPYGPFLCLATMLTITAWNPIWTVTEEYFAFGLEIIGITLLGLLVLFGVLLHIVHQVFSRPLR